MIQKIIDQQSSSSSSQKSNTKLRDLIKNIRACKTAAEERSLVQKEKAAIRESFSNNEVDYRPRNVAKLLFIHMLGHNTDFGQMQCLNLITANSFTEKRIGYLGLTQLFHEKSEVLMMATNSIRQDLNSSSNYIISLALIALSEICTTEMCTTLVKDVLNVMSKGTSFVKKKAALACTKIIKKIPDSLDQVLEKVDKLMEDRHHGVLLSTLGLIEEIVIVEPKTKDHFKKFFSPMIRVMKGLVSSYSAEFDVSGISDPYLQIKILGFFKILAQGNQTLSDEVSDTLANVASTTSSNKNTGNAVLFECVKTIFAIESTNSLKTLGINILGKFLTHKDANSKYCSLYMLKQVLNHDINAVAKHKNMIMDCLRENDSSIKQLALDLTYLISNENNIKGIVKELLNYLLNVNEPDFLKELTLNICLIVDKHSPSRRWYVDTVTKVLTLAGNYIKEESISLLIHLICSTPDLQTYALYKLYYSLQENTNQQGLAKATIYILGEFGTKLTTGQCVGEDDQTIQVSEAEVIDIIEKVFQRVNMDASIKEYGLTCLIKLYTKFTSQKSQIVYLIKAQQHSTHAEVQKRACEYMRLIESDWDGDRQAICDTIPEYEPATENFSSKPIAEINTDGMSKTNPTDKVETKVETNANQIDFDDILGGGDVPPSNGGQNTQNQQAAGGVDDLLDMFDAPPQQNQQQQQQGNQNQVNFDDILFGNNNNQQQNNNMPVNNQQNTFGQQQQLQQQQQQQQGGGLDLMDDFLGGGAQQAPVQQQPKADTESITGYTDNNIDIILNCTRNGQVIDINTNFNNKTGSVVDNIVFQVAVQKHLKLDLNPINSSQIQPNTTGKTTQSMKITNGKQGEKGIAMKVKIGYTLGGQTHSNQVVINNFPQGW